MPDPVCGEGVGQHVEAGEEDEWLEDASLGHGARHDRGGQGGQRQLVEEGEGALRRGAVQPVRLVEELAPAWRSEVLWDQYRAVNDISRAFHNIRRMPIKKPACLA